MKQVVCKCGKGYASSYDNLCKFCRENLVRRSIAKDVGVKHSGDGMSVDQYKVATGQIKRSSVFI